MRIMGKVNMKTNIYKSIGIILALSSLVNGCAKTGDIESSSAHVELPYRLQDGRLTFEQRNVKCDAVMLTDPARIPSEADIYTVERIRDIDHSVLIPAGRDPVRECDDQTYRFFDGYQELMNDHIVYYTEEDYTSEHAEPADISVFDSCFYYTSFDRYFLGLDNYVGNTDLVEHLMTLQTAMVDSRFDSIKSVWNEHDVSFYPLSISYESHNADSQDERQVLVVRQQIGELPVIAPVNINRVSSWEAESEETADKSAVQSPQIRLVDIGDQYEIAEVIEFFDNCQPAGEKVKIKSPLDDLQAVVDSLSIMGSADPASSGATVEIYGIELGYIPVRENDMIKLVPVWAFDCMVRSGSGKVAYLFTTYLDAATLAISEYNY